MGLPRQEETAPFSHHALVPGNEFILVARRWSPKLQSYEAIKRHWGHRSCCSFSWWAHEEVRTEEAWYVSHRVGAKSSDSQPEALSPPPDYTATMSLDGWTELRSSHHIPGRSRVTQECLITSLICSLIPETDTKLP